MRSNFITRPTRRRANKLSTWTSRRCTPGSTKLVRFPWNIPSSCPTPRVASTTNFGLAKVDILPPFELYHPVLPHRQNGKLTFPLCATCVQEEMPKTLLGRRRDCPHTAEQRTLRGTWCTPELQRAVEKGYTITKIHEVWHFPESQRRTGPFAEYLNTWLKIKQESAGYPGWAQTSAQKWEYMHPSLPRKGEHRPRRGVDHQKPRRESHGQTHAELFLGANSARTCANPPPKSSPRLRMSPISSPIPPTTFTRCGSATRRPWKWSTPIPKDNVRGSQQLNHDILHQNVLDELTHPLENRRNVPVANPHFFTRHPATKQLKVIPRTKQYGLVFDKRVVDPQSFQSFPYGYATGLDQEVDMRTVDTLLMF